MPLDPQRVKEIFLAVAEKNNPADRAALLAEACGGDEELRRRVEGLLAAHDASGGWLGSPDPVPVDETPSSSPAPDPEATTDHPRPKLGTLVAGRYKLLEQIGEGGMGTVWVAEQMQPVRRKVAVKLIKAGMDSKTVLSRFEAERQALALMDHPHIAKVLDGGSTEDGRPFFVMEYVKGVPFTQYCDDARLSIAERLALFVPVCQAVQHAHQKGIIHRDLKPSNVLVCLYDGKPVPKVIDFGLAKAMHQPLTEHTLYTAHGMMMGTPLYMSPEQAEFNNLDVDTRTDIYALGVILYELLTGTTPLEKQRFQKAAWHEMLRLIKEEEPPRPSARLSGSGSLPSLAAQRQLEPARLTRLLRGELDWIVMKCLEKDRTRRYETANGLARDLERYLHDEAVEACPPSATYRLRKFVRRNKGRVAAVSLVLLALLVGIVGTTYGLIEARQQRDAADWSRREAEKIAQRERTARKHTMEAVGDITKYVAERNMRKVKVAEGIFVGGHNVQEMLDSPLTPAEKDLLNRLLIYYESTARDFVATADDPTALADAYVQIGHIRKAFRDYASAEVAYQAALIIREELAKNEPSNTENAERLRWTHHDLAGTLRGMGRDAEAVAHWDSVIRLSPPEERWESRLSRAIALARAGRVAEAATECDSVVSESASLGSIYYNAACVYAQAAANSQAHREEYARMGVSLLRRALEKDEFTSLPPILAIEDWKLDPDLAPLRGREDFQRVEAAALIKLLTALEADTQMWASRVEPVARDLIRLSAKDAEPVLRKCLEIRLRDEPEAWTTFNTKSLLGGSLLGQKKYADAEPLLVAGYEGMKRREDKMPQEDKVRLTESLERLVQFYDAWGKKDKADEWRKKLEAAKVAPQPPAKR